MTDKLERLAAARIKLLPAYEISTHYVFERDGFVALVARAGEGFGEIGSPGMLTDRGFATLMWRGGRAFFVGKGFEQEALEEQVHGLRLFALDLKAALC